MEHVGYFAVGHLLLGLALVLFFGPQTQRPWFAIFFVMVLVAAIMGVLDEWHQSFVPGRHGNDLGDIIADTIGGIIAAALLVPASRFIGPQFRSDA